MKHRKNSKPEISIIILNYNGKKYLYRCLKSIYRFPPKSKYEIIVVDNNSTDGSKDMIRKNYPKVKLICNEENLGFTKANNRGIRESKGKFILFLNNDTRVLNKTFDFLLEKIKEDYQLGIVAPALLNEDFSYQLSYGLRPSLKNEFLQKYLFKLAFKLNFKRKKDNWEKEVDWVSGACFLARREILEEIGFFDENFFLYFDDSDLCERIRRQGKKILYYPKPKIIHHLGKSKEIIPLKHAIEYRKSQLYFYRKHRPMIEFKILKIYLLVKFAFLSLFCKILPFNNIKKNRLTYLKVLKVIRKTK